MTITNRTNSCNSDINFIIFDLDGVLADTVSSWVWIHEHFGVNNDASYYEYMAKKIDDPEFMRRDIALWLKKKAKLHINEIQQILDRIPVMLGFQETMSILQYLDIESAIVSAGLELLADRIAKLGNIKHVYANGLETDDQGYLTGEGLLRVKLRNKDEAVRELISQLGLKSEKIAAVGNGEIDIPMFNISGLGIGFNPLDECVSESADVVVQNKDLREIIQYICHLNELPREMRNKCTVK